MDDVAIVSLDDWTGPFPVEKARELLGKKVKVTFESGEVITDVLYDVYLDTYILFAGRDDLYKLAFITEIEEVPRF